MKRKNQIIKILACSLTVLSVMLISANFVFAQCGNYFKTKYTQINPFKDASVSPNPLNDWNGDGRSDMWNFRKDPVTSRYDIVIYPAKPTGYWDWDNPIIYRTPITNYPSGTFSLRDFDGDGRLDLFTGYQIFRNMGDGSLSPLPGFSDSSGSSMRILGFADLNGDNLLDLIYSVLDGYYPGTFTWIPHIRYQTQNPNGSFSNKTTVLTSSAQNGLEYNRSYIGDFNGDSNVDIIYQTNDLGNTEKYVMLLNRGGAIFEAQSPVAPENYPSLGNIRDFNNDGRDDIISSSGTMPYNLIIFYGQANGTLNRQNFPGIRAGQPADLNGDGNLDIIGIPHESDNYTIAINNGAGGFNQTAYPKPFRTTAGSEWRVGDFTGDGKADLFYGQISSPKIYNIFGEELLHIRENVCLPFGEINSINFDGNLSPDVSTWNPNSGNWSSKNAVWGSGADESARNFQWGSGALGDVPAPGDFDGDGKTDYAVYRNSTGVWYVFKSSDSSWMTFQFGTTGDIAVPNDYDGGGKTDFAVFRPSNGGWYFWSSENQQFLGVQFGANGDKPVPADYDGDRKTDIAVFRPSTGVWYYLRSSDNNFRAIQWGTATDKPVPADYDGDGKADLTIYRSGEWWMLRSSNNSVTSISYGTANDIPIPVYRNSISADMTLYNPANNTWNYFANRYAPGIALGGNQDKPVYFGLPNN